MFHLIKILGGRIGVAEPERISLNEAVTVSVGTAVRIANGTLSKMSSASTAPATHVTLADSTGKEVLVAALCPDMLFEVPVSAAPTDMKIGNEYAIDGDGRSVSASAVASGKRGVILVSNEGASLAGDKLTVRFPAY